MPKPKKKLASVEYPPFSRKIVANMTADAFHETPHAGSNYEPDVTEFWQLYQSLRKSEPDWAGITVNSLMLGLVAEGLKACPKMNGHSTFSIRSAHGKVKLYDSIDITMPVVLPEGGMMAVKVPGCESKNLREIQHTVEDILRRLDNTFLDYPLFWLGLRDTLLKLKKGRFDILFRRVFHNFVGPSRMIYLWGKTREYNKIPKEDRMLWHDFEQGTVMVTNLGSVYRGAYAPPVMIDLVPPQIAVVGIAAAVERPGVVTLPDGSKSLAPRMFIPFHIIFDHRAIDYADTVPFMKRLDEIFANPEQIKAWV